MAILSCRSQAQCFIFLSGVGRTMESKLSALGIKTCGDLQCFTMSKLQQEFGPKTGQMLFRFCRGLDDRPVQREKERKSVSAEINYGIRFTQVKTKKLNIILLELLLLNNLITVLTYGFPVVFC